MMKNKLHLLSAIVVVFFIVYLVLLIVDVKKQKIVNRQLWEPWIALEAKNIKYMEIQPVVDLGYSSISNNIIIEDRSLIYKIKDSMSRKPMVESDKSGYHWFSHRRICLKAVANQIEFSFLLFFSDDFPSVQYQMLKKDGRSKIETIGDRWRSAELYNILYDLIDANKSVYWKEVERK